MQEEHALFPMGRQRALSTKEKHHQMPDNLSINVKPNKGRSALREGQCLAVLPDSYLQNYQMAALAVIQTIGSILPAAFWSIPCCIRAQCST
eukprot:scaffold65029_cov28-Prasinocladus_malaysianus.AAC.1